MMLEYPERGVFGTLILERLEGLTNQNYHKAVLDNVTANGGKVDGDEPEERKVNGTSFLVSEVEGGKAPNGVSLRYSVSTATVGDRLVQFLLYATPENFASSRAAIRAGLSGFTIARTDLRPVRHIGASFVDDQLGFSFTPRGRGWGRGKVTALPGDMGRVVEWHRRGHTVVALALRAGSNGIDSRATDRFIQKNLVARMQKQLGVKLTDSFTLRKAGNPVLHRAGKDPNGLPTLDVATIRAGGLVIALVLANRDGGGLSIDEALAGLKILP